MANIDRHGIPELIKAARIQQGLTQKQLGMACGYPEKSADTNVRCWESGKAPIPNAKLRTVSDLLKLPLDVLLP